MLAQFKKSIAGSASLSLHLRVPSRNRVSAEYLRRKSARTNCPKPLLHFGRRIEMTWESVSILVRSARTSGGASRATVGRFDRIAAPPAPLAWQSVAGPRERRTPHASLCCRTENWLDFVALLLTGRSPSFIDSSTLGKALRVDALLLPGFPASRGMTASSSRR